MASHPTVAEDGSIPKEQHRVAGSLLLLGVKLSELLSGHPPHGWEIFGEEGNDRATSPSPAFGFHVPPAPCAGEENPGHNPQLNVPKWLKMIHSCVVPLAGEGREVAAEGQAGGVSRPQAFLGMKRSFQVIIPTLCSHKRPHRAEVFKQLV